MRAVVLLHPRQHLTSSRWPGIVMPFVADREYALSSITNEWRTAGKLAAAGEVDVVVALTEPPLRLQLQLMVAGVRLEVLR